MITAVQGVNTQQYFSHNKQFHKTVQKTPIVINNASHKFSYVDGSSLIARQISFGINKKNIKNYNKEEIEFLEFRQKFSRKLHKKSVIAEKACWDFYINSTDENLKNYENAQDELFKIYQDKRTYKYLDKFSKKDIKNPLLKRQLAMLLEDFESKNKYKKELKQLSDTENAIAAKYNSYQHEIDGQRVSKLQIEEILRTSKDEGLRKKAYEALAKHGDVIADDMINLVKKRNEFAKKLGFNTYFDYMLQSNYDITSDEISALFDDLSNSAWLVSKRYIEEKEAKLQDIFQTKHLKPWHYSYVLEENPFNQADEIIKDKDTLVNTAKEMYKSMGWEIDKLPVIMDLFPKENKNSHAFCFDIDTNKDVRILANLKNQTSSLRTLCHELGHSVYDLGISSRLPYLNREPASSAMTEAVAQMMESLYVKENLLQEKFGVSKDMIQKLKQHNLIMKANFVQRCVFLFKFEKALYENPDQNLKRLWYDLGEFYEGIKSPKKTYNAWCNIPHFLSHPAYYQNYLRAEIIAEQLYDSSVKKLGALTKNPNTAKYMKKLFKTGSLYSESETLKRFTGKPLNVWAYKDVLQRLIYQLGW